MSIQSQIERIQLNRDIIRAKMVDAGQASLNDDFDTLTENLTVYPIDNSLSNMSENPVQNKVIKAELDKVYKTDDISGTDLADADYIPFYDSSASAKKKTLFSNLFDKLKTMTGATSSVAGAKGLVPAPALGDNEKYLRGDGTWQTGINTFANAFSRGDIIDTTERIVGMFMGKPMYQKVIVTGALTEANTRVQHGISNIDKIVYVEGTFSNESNNKWTTTGGYNGAIIAAGDDDSTTPYADNTYAGWYSGSDIKNWVTDSVITLRYTKTTDTANAIKYGTGNDYSLDEHIVGTWIDGKPLYQKTFVNTIPTVETSGETADNDIDVSSLNIDYVTVKEASAMNNVNQIDLPMYAYTVTDNLKLQGTTCYVMNSRKTLRIRNSYASYNGRTIWVTIQYTKTS